MDKESFNRALVDLPSRPWRLQMRGDYFQIVDSNDDVLVIVVHPKDAAAERLAHFITEVVDLDLANEDEDEKEIDALREALVPHIEQLKANFGNVCPEVFAEIDKLTGSD